MPQMTVLTADGSACDAVVSPVVVHAVGPRRALSKPACWQSSEDLPLTKTSSVQWTRGRRSPLHTPERSVARPEPGRLAHSLSLTWRHHPATPGM